MVTFETYVYDKLEKIHKTLDEILKELKTHKD